MLITWVVGGDSIAGSQGSWFFQYLGVTTTGDAGVPAVQSAQTYYATKGANSIVARNMGISGTRLNTNGFPDLVPLAPGYIDPIFASQTGIGTGGSTPLSRRASIFSCAIGRNDGAIAAYATPTLFAAAVASACRDRKAAGAQKLIMATILPAASIPTEPNRLAFNATITDPAWMAANQIDGIFDFASEPTMGNPANISNPTYYADQIHPTAAGYALLVPYVTSTMNAVIASLGG